MGTSGIRRFLVPFQAIHDTRRNFLGLKIHTFILLIALIDVGIIFIEFGRWKDITQYICHYHLHYLFVFFDAILDLPKTYCSIQGGHISGIVSRMSNPGAQDPSDE